MRQATYHLPIHRSHANALQGKPITFTERLPFTCLSRAATDFEKETLPLPVTRLSSPPKYCYARRVSTREARKAQLTLSRVGRTAAGPYLSDSLVILGAQTVGVGVHS